MGLFSAMGAKAVQYTKKREFSVLLLNTAIMNHIPSVLSELLAPSHRLWTSRTSNRSNILFSCRAQSTECEIHQAAASMRHSVIKSAALTGARVSILDLNLLFCWGLRLLLISFNLSQPRKGLMATTSRKHWNALQLSGKLM
ncbi:hypothetical protein AMECASPLE_026060 [Ameca splendens]|uniref:Uncharacterized protein n=1 Tax=Ameca splendens TaxID=208324 RepID=A0ABV0Y511_9TELE